jgi:hypothetical protein
MKKFSILLFVAVIFNSCTSNKEDVVDEYLAFDWYEDDKLTFEGGMYHSPTGYNPEAQSTEGDSMVPIRRVDSMIILDYSISYETVDSVSHEIQTQWKNVSDTFLFEFRNFHGPKLVLIPESGIAQPGVFYLKDQEIESFEEQLIINPIEFELGGLSIGDTIDRDDYTFNDIIEENYLYNYFAEEAELKSNPNVEAHIFNDFYIVNIKQRKIESNDIDNIIEVVNNKIGFEPRYSQRQMEGDAHWEHYSWRKDGVVISLTRYEYSKKDMFWLNMGWTLNYSNEIYIGLVKSLYPKKKAQSIIIK